MIELAKNIKKKDSDLSQHMRDWYVKTRGCTKTEMALVLTDPEFMLTSSLKDKILSQNSIRLIQNDNFKKKSLYDKLMIIPVRKPQTDKVARGPGTGESMAVGNYK